MHDLAAKYIRKRLKLTGFRTLHRFSKLADAKMPEWLVDKYTSFGKLPSNRTKKPPAGYYLVK